MAFWMLEELQRMPARDMMCRVYAVRVEEETREMKEVFVEA